MDPVSAGLLVALAGGAGGELGRQVWAGLGALVRRPFRHPEAGDDGGEASVLPAGGSGEEELTALAQAPADEERAAALSAVLARRAAGDTQFAAELERWRQQAAQVPLGGGVHNHISGGTFHAPVLQGQNFSGLTFGASPAAPPAAQDSEAGPESGPGSAGPSPAAG
jgi:hypothetical protein